MQNKTTSFLFILLSFLLHACNDNSQSSNENKNILNPELSAENKIPNEYKSQLRPTEKIELGKTYIDTANYLSFDTDTDDWLFIVEKNKDIVALVYNNEQELKFVKGDKIVINWKVDSLRNAGDSEVLYFTEFLISYQKIDESSLSILQDQNKYYTIADNGLIVRKEPSIKSDRIGKIPYGSIIRLLEQTELKLQIVDHGDTLTGFWVKVRFDNFPYKVSQVDDFEFEEEGYVFNKFIEKLNKASLDTKEIDSLKFHTLYKPSANSNLTKITSQKKIKRLLTSKIKWKNSTNVQGQIIDKVILNDRQTLHFIPDDLSLIAYYPTEEILLFEGGHGSEFSISTKTGESLETIGNPEQIIESPNKKFRLNGWFSGQECSSYFFQEKSGNKYIYLADFGWGSEKFGKNVCYFNNFCWLNDGEFIYSYTDHSGEKSEERYYTGQINYL